MTENLYVDPAHRVPDEQWAQVVRNAEAINAAHLENKTGGASSPAGPLVNMLGSGKHSGVSGIPTQLLVLHSGECPLRGGYAQSLTNWANTPIDRGGPIASWHWFIDPIARVRMIEEVYAAWHASEANPISEGFEQAGYARFTRADWLTPDGLLQMESLAYTMAQRAKVNGIPARWLTTAEVTRATSGDRTVKGFCLHRQIDPETRTDPGDGYPYELLMAKVKAYMGGTIQTQSTEEDTLSAAEVQEIKDHINAVLIGGYSWSDGRHPGVGMVVEEEQRRAAKDRVTLPAAIAAAVWATPVKRASGNVSALQELADAKTKIFGIEPVIARIDTNTDPAALADLIPDALAQQVIDKLAERLAK